MSRPRVISPCVAHRHAARVNDDIRIIEFAGSDSEHGGLISFELRDGRMIVDVYRAGTAVEVRCDPALLVSAPRP